MSSKRKIGLLWLAVLLLGLVLLSACQKGESEPTSEASGTTEETAARPMMGPGSGMMARHHATIPEEYSGLENPVAADEDSVKHGEEIFATNCATCHGEEGMGDGPGGANLDPAPAPIAHTARMLSDGYLFWRISEGGAMEPFNSAMPTWKGSLDEEARWDVINYLRVLSGGAPAPGAFDAQAEAEKRTEMLAQALEQGLIDEDEAALFDDVHSAMDELLAERPMGAGRMMGAGQDDVLAELVAQGTFSEEQIQAFNDIHDRLLMAGLMQ